MNFPAILFGDENFLVVDKPSGLNVHSDGKTKEITLVDLILEKYPELREVGEPWFSFRETQTNADRTQTDAEKYGPRAGIAHRLDKDTSGVIVIAKNNDAFFHIKKQFQEHTIEKVYHAIVWGHPKDDVGIISAPIARAKSDIRKWTAIPKAQRGSATLRDAETRWRVLKRFEINGDKLSLLELKPQTGRTHQFALHFQSLNPPIVCDSLYASSKPCPPEIGRLALHAPSIAFHDLSGKMITVKSGIPPEFDFTVK